MLSIVMLIIVMQSADMLSTVKLSIVTLVFGFCYDSIRSQAELSSVSLY
jgi:hypothetical protein